MADSINNNAGLPLTSGLMTPVAMTPDEQAVERRVSDLCTEIKRLSGRSVSIEDVAAVLLTLDHRAALAQPKLADEQAVERVAEAIHAARWQPGDEGRIIPLGQDSPASQEYARRLARAAIAALAQPKVGDGEIEEGGWSAEMIIDGLYRRDVNAFDRAAALLERLTSP